MSDYWKDNNITKPQQIVVCAACKRGDVIIAGARHYDKVMRSQILAIDVKTHFYGEEWKEGFIDQFGDFLTRKEAMQIAIKAGQKVDIKRGCGNTEFLFSEGLY